MASSGFCLVTPASRGLGFAFARYLLANSNLPVVATARQNCDEVHDQLLSGIKDKERLQVLPVDVIDESSISSMTSYLRDTYPNTPLRLALTLPGILHVEKSPSQISASNALHSFQVNALGPLLLMKHLTPFLPTKSSPPFEPTRDGVNLPSHAIYAMMAARVGSISDNSSGGWYSYRASKAAVFQLAKTLDLHLRTRSRERSCAVALHPGTVRTDFTREYWDGREMLAADEAAGKLLGVLVEMGMEGRGRCWDWRGEEVVP
ncbi:uncharacterized protein ASPGLDRAFT_124028 [Aspergillus glaucus CBS 516.65]|uniref:Short-chain dehydrogenase/reductase n=1 Tax=Aspergillus glaucus CBS 516.65 TaxID=1160497 RepID=A0A1L9VNF7_ASPGL|nr:hypothetical protein ASPGLDRAFT_124028 [Aspergillus glaucus CBS 516.65]OJJ85436.1 hypothetical protein ASPGLDRAFT_124028 [Aspergillus glaucus CBS 516.65]